MRLVAAVVTLAVTACSPAAARDRLAADGFFPSGDIRLHYRIDRPASGRPPFPAVVLGHGSGRISRDDQRFFVDRLVSRGFVVLRFSKRGVGESGGEYSGVGVKNGDRMFDLLSDDMAAGAAFLRRDADVDPARVGFLGASQAGWIIPLAAVKAHPAFMILLSGPTVTIGEENYYSAFAEFGNSSIDEAHEKLRTYTGPRGFDPVPVLERLDVPGLWLLGTADESIPERPTAAILEGLRRRGRPFQVVEYPGANHGLFIVGESRPAPIWDDIDRFLARVFGPRG